jgi:outer membrane lipoprotein-sorting protein
LRYLVPVAVVAVLFAGYSVRDRLEARAEPSLPERTAAEVADMAAAPHPEPRSGFLELRTSLGLGDFGTATGESGGSLVGLASGNNDARLWQDGDRRRIALLEELGETDWYRQGDTTYVWHSRRSRVTKVETPETPADANGLITSLAGGGTIESPDGMAARFLAFRDQSTRLVLRAPTHVADRPVYQLGLVPETGTSLITEVTIAVDAETGLPLKVSVNTRSGTVAIESKFTSIKFARPSESNFAFRPPPEAVVTDGAKVSRERDFSGDWQKERDRERALEDVQSVTGVNQTLLRLATVGDGWNEVVAVSGLDWWRVDDLTRTAKTVTGTYGTGQVLETPVFTLLILPNGRIVAGAVTPKGLEPAAEQVAVVR